MSTDAGHEPNPGLQDDGLTARPWRLGALTLLAVAVVVGGVLSLRSCGSDEPAASASDISLPPMPTSAADSSAAPDFSVDLFDGTRFVLGEHLREDGRPVILNLWASWCPPCRAEMPDFEAAAKAHPEVLIIGVAVDDDPIAAEDFAEEIEISYPVGADEADRVHRRYPSAGLPATYVIGTDGSLLQSVFGQLSAEQIDGLIDLAVAG